MYERNEILQYENLEPMETYAEDIRNDETNCITNYNAYRITENTITAMRDAVGRLRYKWKDTCDYPIFVVNLNNESPGVTCKALAYYADKVCKTNKFKRPTTDKDRNFISYMQPKKYFQDGSYTPNNDHRYQKNESPFNSVEQNDRTTKNVQVSYVLSQDNRRDGSSLGKFYTGAGSK